MVWRTFFRPRWPCWLGWVKRATAYLVFAFRVKRSFWPLAVVPTWVGIIITTSPASSPPTAGTPAVSAPAPDGEPRRVC